MRQGASLRAHGWPRRGNATNEPHPLPPAPDLPANKPPPAPSRFVLLSSSRHLPVSAWEDTIGRRMRTLHLGSVRNQILAFAVLATLIPTFVTALTSYQQNRESLIETMAAELRGATSESAREIGSWLGERLDAMRAAAGSYVVAENVAKIDGRDGAKA